MRKIVILLAVVGLLYGLPSACYYDNRAEILAANPLDSCSTVDVSYNLDIKPIIEARCSVPGCHNANSQAAGLDLSTFTGVKAIADNGSFVGRITATGSALMPQGGPPLPRCDIDKIEAWVADGALEN